MKRKLARRFVVGYESLGGSRIVTVWGDRAFLPRRHKGHRPTDYCNPMTSAAAQKAVQNMPCAGAVVYELTPVTKKPPKEL